MKTICIMSKIVNNPISVDINNEINESIPIIDGKIAVTIRMDTGIVILDPLCRLIRDEVREQIEPCVVNTIRNERYVSDLFLPLKSLERVAKEHDWKLHFSR